MANPLATTIAEKARALYAAREAALTSGPRHLDMTELYDFRDESGAAWLDAAERQLNSAVADAYGWSPDLSDDEILATLGALHQSRQGDGMGTEDETENGIAVEEPAIRAS